MTRPIGRAHHVASPDSLLLTTVPIAPVPSGNFIHVGGLAVRPSDGLLFAAAREATVAQHGDIYQLTPGGIPTLVGSTGVGEVGDLTFAPIPEPATILLLGAGLAGLVATARIGGRQRTEPQATSLNDKVVSFTAGVSARVIAKNK